MFKDQLGMEIMIEFCALRAKTYSYRLDDDTEEKKAKGTNSKKKYFFKKHFFK